MKESLVRLIPACFVIGAGMEFFMINTGFYNIAGRKEADRRYERSQEEAALMARMKKYNIKFDDDEEKKVK